MYQHREGRLNTCAACGKDIAIIKNGEIVAHEQHYARGHTTRRSITLWCRQGAVVRGPRKIRREII